MKYRKKPIVVDAYQYTKTSFSERRSWPEWLKELYNQKCMFDRTIYEDGLPVFTPILIKTLEGEIRVSENDWIIKGVKGELYPCKPDIFEKIYEKVEE